MGWLRDKLTGSGSKADRLVEETEAYLREQATNGREWTVADLFVTCLAVSLLGIAGVCLVLSLTPLVDEPPPDTQQPGCWCERMDLGTGDTLTLPDPHCPVHQLEMLAATLRDHVPGCRCGCGGAR